MTVRSALRWRLPARAIELGSKPCIMGVLNVTPDSFSDGGRFLSLQSAVDRALQMEDEGADIIDIGGESTRPFAPPLSERDEADRVVPVIAKLASRLSIPLSIDTYKASVAREALEAGVEIVNDISSMTFDHEMLPVVKEFAAGVVLMHTRGRPEDMQLNTSYDDIVHEISLFFKDVLHRIDLAGIKRETVVLDPGIGFGKDLHGNLEILRRLSEFAVLGLPLLVGSSRKSFIGKVLDRDVDWRIFGTAATVAVAMMNGASIIRVHDVSQMKDVAVMTRAICDGFDNSTAV